MIEDLTPGREVQTQDRVYGPSQRSSFKREKTADLTGSKTKKVEHLFGAEDD